MATSAAARYSAVQVGGAYNYTFEIKNTSPAPYDIYAILLGAQYNVPGPNNPTQLNNVVFISSPTGWSGSVFATTGWTGPSSANGIDWSTNFQGSAAASGYIMPGQTRVFIFQSSSVPQQQLVFGCCFYDGANAWGYCFNGTARLVDEIPHPKWKTYNIINPLVLILGDEVFVRLNLPRPASIVGLRESLGAGIRSMTPEQREIAGAALGAYIVAFTEVRVALEGTRESGTKE